MQARRRWRLLSKGLFTLAGLVFVGLIFLGTTRNASDETAVWFMTFAVGVSAPGSAG